MTLRKKLFLIFLCVFGLNTLGLGQAMCWAAESAATKASQIPKKKIQQVTAASSNARPRSLSGSGSPSGQPAMARQPAGLSDSNTALEVRGQSRNLSMMLVLKNRKSDIDFVKPRETYSTEVQNTAY